MKPGENPLAGISGDLWDVSAEIEPGRANEVETFGNDGEAAIPTCFLPEDESRGLELFASGGTARVISLDVYPMTSCWPVT